ncbi:hypothetical protein KY092_08045 [Natronomonas gomsonensis]|uniref:hypothetical protein n=1 Tax=Natronomonas gomsonensis TaxID=1046043 RepID=UPI0020CA416B|nr:hypothetical protein [Natronomonas gomsonensis]MCY4730508.1 hypothetical protein [Natronomonas gomsonensis]
MSFAEAFREMEQDLSEIQEETLVDVDRLRECNECGEPVEEAVYLYPVQKQCVTIQCGGCGSVYDVWNNDLQRGENQG